MQKYNFEFYAEWGFLLSTLSELFLQYNEPLARKDAENVSIALSEPNALVDRLDWPTADSSALKLVFVMFCCLQGGRKTTSG